MMGGYRRTTAARSWCRRRGPRSGGARFYARASCACASVHGANRLGNEFAHRSAGLRQGGRESIIKFLQENPGTRTCPGRAERTQARLAALDGQKNGESVAEVGTEIRRTMQAHCGVFRFPDMLAKG